MHPVFTIGHSRHAPDEFLQLLAAQAVDLLVDVRAQPWSRRNPQFNRDALQASLAAQGLRYRWLGEALGGLRVGGAGNAHAALPEAAFRAYAEHMASPAFGQVLERLCEGAQRRRMALMCAEADVAQCHRRFIADALALRGVEVRHILATSTTQPHVPHPALRVVDGVMRYDGLSQPTLFDVEHPA